MVMCMIVEGLGQKIEFGQKRYLEFLFLVAKTEVGQAGFSAQMAQTFIKRHTNFKANTFKLYKASAELTQRTGMKNCSMQTLCKKIVVDDFNVKRKMADLFIRTD